MPFHRLIENWLAVHEYFVADSATALHTARTLRLEDFTKSPAQHLTELWSWMGLEVAPGQAQAVLDRYPIQIDPNQKYREQYCEYITGRRHAVLIEAYNERVKALGLGYDISSWCNNSLN